MPVNLAYYHCIAVENSFSVSDASSKLVFVPTVSIGTGNDANV